MEDLDNIWPQLLDAAAQKAVADGRHDLADYLRVKAMNDRIRAAASDWLIDSFIGEVSRHMSPDGRLTVEIVEPYSYKAGNSTMVGRAIEAKLGVRKLTVAVGWPRTPSHGILTRQSLAAGRITHFGMARAGAEFRLIHTDELPRWVDEEAAQVGEEYIRHHVEIFLG